MRITKFHKPILLTVIGLACLGLLLFNSRQASAANPTTINFQGKIVNAADGTNIAAPTGTYSIVFRIYNTSSPTMTTACSTTASCLWQETQSSVQLTNGIFQVELGSVCALTSSSCNNTAGGPINFASSNSLYLTMQFNGDTSGSNGGFMSPLIHITSVPFALQADNSATLGGLAASNFVQLAQGLQTDASTTNASIAINKTNASGSPDILLLQKSGKNVLEVNNSGSVLLGQAGASGLNGTLTFNNSVGSNTVSFSLQADPGSSYTLLLPTTGPAVSQCLQTDGTTANQLVFAACATGGSGVTSVAYSATANASGGSISGSVLTLAKADGSNPGLLSADAQTIGGDKTFNGSIKITGSGTRPASPTAGMLYYDTTTNQLIQYNGSKWVSDRNTATKIVAANNSTQAEKDAADYVSTGSGDEATINSALNALPAGGGVVYLMEGTYSIGFPGISLPNNTTLSGAGAGTIITLPNGQNASYSMIANSDTSTGTGIYIRDIALDGNKVNQSSGSMYGINIAGVGNGSNKNGARISQVYVANIYGSNAGIALTNSANSSINGSTTEGTCGLYTSSSNSVISNNTVLDSCDSGIELKNSSYDSVTGNTIKNSLNEGIFIFSSSSITVTGNTEFNTSNGPGISIYISNHATVTGNYLELNTYGIYSYSSYENNVTGNNISRSTGNGILLTTSSNRNIISSNKIQDSGGSTGNNGIYLNNSSQYNTLSNNNISDITGCTSTCYAININDTSSLGNYISDNMFEGDGIVPATVRDVTTGGNSYSAQPLSENNDASFRNAYNSTSAFQVQNAAGYSILSVNTSFGQVLLGAASHNNGTIVFNNSGGSGTAAITLAGNPITNYTYQLPTGTVNSNSCLQSGTVSSGTVPLTFGSCGGGYATVQDEGSGLTQRSTLNFTGSGVSCADNAGNTRTDCTINNTSLASGYNSAATTGNTILLAQNGGGVIIQDAATPITGSDLFDVQSNGGTKYLSVSSAGSGTVAVSGNFSATGTVSVGAGNVFKVGTTSGVSQSACGANQYSQNAVATGGIITTAGSCAYAVNAIGTFAGASIANGASVTNNQIIFGAADGTNPGIVTTSGTQTFGGTKVFSGAVTVQNASGLTIGTTSTAGVLALFNGTNTVSIQGAGSTTAYSIILPATAATAANQCLASTGASGTLQWLPCGAGSTATVTLSPEYPGATMSSDGTSNTGTMTSDFCSNTVGSVPNINTSACASGQSHNYYSWTSASGTNNYDVWVRWQAPSDFSSLSTFTVYGWRTTSSSSVKVTIFDGSTQCTTTPTDVATGTATWTSATVPNNSCTINAGDVLTVRVKLTAAASEFARAGEITITYNRK